MLLLFHWQTGWASSADLHRETQIHAKPAAEAGPHWAHAPSAWAPRHLRRRAVSDYYRKQSRTPLVSREELHSALRRVGVEDEARRQTVIEKADALLGEFQAVVRQISDGVNPQDWSVLMASVARRIRRGSLNVDKNAPHVTTKSLEAWRAEEERYERSTPDQIARSGATWILRGTTRGQMQTVRHQLGEIGGRLELPGAFRIGGKFHSRRVTSKDIQSHPWLAAGALFYFLGHADLLARAIGDALQAQVDEDNHERKPLLLTAEAQAIRSWMRHVKPTTSSAYLGPSFFDRHVKPMDVWTMEHTMGQSSQNLDSFVLLKRAAANTELVQGILRRLLIPSEHHRFAARLMQAKQWERDARELGLETLVLGAPHGEFGEQMGDRADDMRARAAELIRRGTL